MFPTPWNIFIQHFFFFPCCKLYRQSFQLLNCCITRGPNQLLLLWQAAVLAEFPAEHDNACKAWPGKAHWEVLHPRDTQRSGFGCDACAEPLSPERGSLEWEFLERMGKHRILHTADTPVITHGFEGR